ncbi:hypothetical protein AAFF_G00038730, partial [Aldrovandia affinis]
MCAARGDTTLGRPVILAGKVTDRQAGYSHNSTSHINRKSTPGPALVISPNRRRHLAVRLWGRGESEPARVRRGAGKGVRGSAQRVRRPVVCLRDSRSAVEVPRPYEPSDHSWKSGSKALRIGAGEAHASRAAGSQLGQGGDGVLTGCLACPENTVGPRRKHLTRRHSSDSQDVPLPSHLATALAVFQRMGIKKALNQTLALEKGDVALGDVSGSGWVGGGPPTLGQAPQRRSQIKRGTAGVVISWCSSRQFVCQLSVSALCSGDVVSRPRRRKERVGSEAGKRREGMCHRWAGPHILLDEERFQSSLFKFLRWVRALEVTVSQSSIQVARGQTALLPCTFTTSAALNSLNIIWLVTPLSNAHQPVQVMIYQGGQVFIPSQLSGRVGFANTMPSTSASIFINNTQLSDTGTYQCLVNNLPDRGGRNIGIVGLTVLVPPSIPSCRIQGSLDVGSDIVLMCTSEEGIPTPTYAWEKLESVPKLPHSAMQDQMQGTVALRNISTGNSGLYQCTASNAIGKSTCLLNLQVVAPQAQSIGLIAGTIATGVLAVIICSLLVVVTLCYWKNKNKYEEDEIPNEIREDDLPPKRSSSVKAFHADASSSENDTLTSTNTYNSRYWHNPKPNYDTNSYTRYNGDTRQTFSGHAGAGAGAGAGSGVGSGVGSGAGAAPPARPAYTNGSHTLPPPKTLVVTTNSAPSPTAMVRSNGSVSLKPVPPHGQHTHSYAVSQATLERMGAVPVMVPAQSRAGSL